MWSRTEMTVDGRNSGVSVNSQSTPSVTYVTPSRDQLTLRASSRVLPHSSFLSQNVFHPILGSTNASISEKDRTRIRDVARSIRHGQGPCDSEGDLRVRLFPSLAGAGAFIRFPPSQNFSHRSYRSSRGWWKRMRTPWCFIRPGVRPPYRARHS